MDRFGRAFMPFSSARDLQHHARMPLALSSAPL